MKTFPLILINKSDMRKIEHYKDADKLALHLAKMDGSPFNAENWLIIKDEKKVVDLLPLRGKVGISTQYHAIKKAIEEA